MTQCFIYRLPKVEVQHHCYVARGGQHQYCRGRRTKHPRIPAWANLIICSTAAKYKPQPRRLRSQPCSNPRPKSSFTYHHLVRVDCRDISQISERQWIGNLTVVSVRPSFLSYFFIVLFSASAIGTSQLTPTLTNKDLPQLPSVPIHTETQQSDCPDRHDLSERTQAQ
jgi:hypothetical protein